MEGQLETELESLVAQLEESRASCARLARDNAELQRRLAGSGGQLPPVDPAPADIALISRRGALGKALGAAVVTVVGAGALVERATAPAAASDGSSVVAGSATTAEARTSVVYDGVGGFTGVVLLGNDSTYGGQSANYPAALGGFAGAGATAGKGGVANGIYGFTDNGAGNAVVGYNSGALTGSGAGVLGLAFGAKNIAVEGHNTQGAAVSGTTDSTAADATAVIGLVSSASPGGFSSAVRGQNNGTGDLGIGVWASHAGSGWGVYATSVGGIGVNANGGTGTGVSASGATAVSASGQTTGVQSSGQTAVSAKGATLGLDASGATAVNATGTATGVSASGPTAVSATGTTIGVAAAAPTAVSAAGTFIGLSASGPTAVVAGGTTTGLNATGPTAVVADGTSLGLSASGATAVVAKGTVVGLSAAGSTGIEVTGSGADGVAVSALAAGNAPAVQVTNSGTGPGLAAVIQGSPSTGTAAVVGDSKSGTGVLGLSNDAIAVEGRSKGGRGASFSGALAQVRLAPGSLATHPSTGERGDLYCDRNGRLWFCKSGGSRPIWKQLA